MPKKKSVKKVSGKKTSKSKKTVKRAKSKPKAKKSVKSVKPVVMRRVPRRSGAPRDKIRVVLKNLITFGVLFILSVVIGIISTNKFIDQLFWIVAILTAFVAVAFLIVLLILFFMRQVR